MNHLPLRALRVSAVNPFRLLAVLPFCLLALPGGGPGEDRNLRRAKLDACEPIT